MKVLNAIALLDPVYGGGTAERTYQMSKALAHAGVDCVILSTDVGLRDEWVASIKGVKVVALHCINRRFFIFLFSWSTLKKIVADADVVHLMGHWSMLNVLVYLLAKRTGTPYVICPAGELRLFGRSRWIKKLFNAVIGYRLVREAAGHIAVTPDEIPVYESYGITAEFVTVIPNGVNEADFQPGEASSFSRQFGLGNNPFILFMGRLNPIKGPDLLLDAFCRVANQFPAYHLVFAGPDGGLLNNLQQTTKERGMSDRVHFVGYVAGQDKVNAYHEAHFLVIPSRQEAMSIVVLEAGVSGTPVLLSDRCGFNQVDAVGGGRVVPANVNGLAEGLAEIMNRQVGLAEMGERLRCFVRNNFTWDLICLRYLALYRQIAANKNVATKTNQ
jgi:glycosyltransferase involved in cell wall biosynthesis